jgi:hypothetical protein
VAQNGAEAWWQRLWNAWKAFGHKMGTFQTRLLLTVFYFVIVAPFACGVRLFQDPLRKSARRSSNWVEKGIGHTDVWKQAHKEF